MLNVNPTQEPMIPGCERKASSSSLCPFRRQALRKRMWQALMEPHVKIRDRPLMAMSQSRAVLRVSCFRSVMF